MARDADALNLLTKWASTGDVRTPEDAGLTRANGWPSSYEQNGGDKVSRRVFNQIFRELSGLALEINTRGILEWNTGIDYVHPAAVLGSNGTVYISTANSGPNSGGSIDPEGTSGSTRWTSLTPDGSATARGMLELATTAEATAGTDTARAVNAAGVRAAGDARWQRRLRDSSVDLDDLVAAGRYRVHSSSNANAPPSVTTAFMLEVTVDTPGARIRQDAYPFGTGAIERAWVWTRSSNNTGGSWSAWENVVERLELVTHGTDTWREREAYTFFTSFITEDAPRVVSGGLTYTGAGQTGEYTTSYIERESATVMWIHLIRVSDGNLVRARIQASQNDAFCTNKSLAI